MRMWLGIARTPLWLGVLLAVGCYSSAPLLRKFLNAEILSLLLSRLLQFSRTVCADLWSTIGGGATEAVAG